MTSSLKTELLLKADNGSGSVSAELGYNIDAEDSLIRKSEDAAVTVPSLRKDLTLIDGICFVVSVTVGSGIFTSPGVALNYAGSVALAFVAWSAAAVIAICSGLVYAELGSSLPSAGGDAHYYEVVFGKFVSFVYMWNLFFVINGGSTALIALTFARYMAYAIFSLDVQARNIDSDIRIVLLGVSSIAVSTIFNCFGVQVRSMLQYVFLLCKFMLVVLLLVAALTFLSRDTSIVKHNFSEASKGGNFSGFGPAVMAALWPFLGWSDVVYLTEEMKNPKKDVSRAIFVGIGIVTSIYLCLNAAYLSVLTTTDVKTSVVIGMETAMVALGPQAGQIIAILVAASTLGTLNSTVLWNGRYLYAAARSGYIFSWMGHIGKKNGAPYIALIALGSWCICILTFLQGFHQILGYFGPVSLFFIGLTAAAHIKIRRDLPHLPRAYTVKFYPYIPIIVILACLYLIVTSFIATLLPTLLAFGLAFISLPCYGLSQCYHRWKGSNLKAFSIA